MHSLAVLFVEGRDVVIIESFLRFSFSALVSLVVDVFNRLVLWKDNCSMNLQLCVWIGIVQTSRRHVPYLFVRGDGVILVSPPLRTS